MLSFSYTEYRSHTCALLVTIQTPTLEFRHKVGDFFSDQGCHLPVNNLVDLIVVRRGNSNPTVWADPCDCHQRTFSVLARYTWRISQPFFIFILFVIAKLLSYTCHSLPGTHMYWELQQPEAPGICVWGGREKRRESEEWDKHFSTAWNLSRETIFNPKSSRHILWEDVVDNIFYFLLVARCTKFLRGGWGWGVGGLP